jgi:hypothetical protein
MGYVERHSEWVAALVGGLVGGIAFATSWKLAPTKDAWDIVTAIGTIGATVAAVGISLVSSFAKRRESADAASLAAARVSVEVESALAFMGAAHGWLAFYRDEQQAGTKSFELAFRTSIKSAQVDIAPSDLQALIALPNRCAHRLARAMASLRSLANNVDLMDDFFDAHPATVRQYRNAREDAVSRWRATAAEILDLLRVAHRELVAATHLSAPIPDLKEVYGIPFEPDE